MRISTAQLYQGALSSLNDLAARQAEAQRQISGGSRVVRASDDVGAVSRGSSLAQARARTQVFDDNLNALDSRYAQADTSLASVSDVLARVQVSLTQARNGALGPSERVALATAIGQDLDSVRAALARADARGVPLYSGGAADAVHAPLEVQPGVVLDSEIPLAADAQAALTTLGSAGWLQDLRSAPRADDAGLAAALDQVQGLAGQVLQARVVVGARWQTVAAYQDEQASQRLLIDDERSRTLDPDIGQATADLTLAGAQLEAARALFSRIQSGSLFDKLG